MSVETEQPQTTEREPVARQVLTYEPPKPVPLWRRATRWWTLRRAVIAATVVCVAVGGYVLARWVAGWPKPFEIRPAEVDGADVVAATGMKLYKFQVTVPDGKWELHYRLNEYRNGAKTPTGTGSGNVGQLVPGDNYVYLYLRDEPTPMVYMGIRGGHVGTSRPRTGNALSWGTNFHGIAKPNVPHVLYTLGWNHSSGISGVRVPYAPGSTDGGMDIIITIVPAGTALNAAPATTSPTTATPSAGGKP